MIEIKNVSFRYDADPGEKPVVRNINLEIKTGEFVAVLGHNGSGKSTLAKLLNAILLPTEGRVAVDGMDTADAKLLFDIRKNVGMVFQNPDNQIVATMVEEDVAFGPENIGVAPDEIRRRVDEALKAVKMYEYREKAPHMLSGGQKQRVAIAGILAMQPRSIVLDEPTAMLDPSGRAEVMETVRRLNREQNMTIVLITHYMDEAVKAGRIIVMDQGEIIMDAPPREVFSQVKRLKEAGLDVPQVTELAFELKKHGVDIRTDILRSAECIDELVRLIGGAV